MTSINFSAFLIKQDFQSFANNQERTKLWHSYCLFNSEPYVSPFLPTTHLTTIKGKYEEGGYHVIIIAVGTTVTELKRHKFSYSRYIFLWVHELL